MANRQGKTVASDQTQKRASDPKPVPPATDNVPAGKPPPRETGGPKGREPTRYQDWERGGRCIDF